MNITRFIQNFLKYIVVHTLFFTIKPVCAISLLHSHASIHNNLLTYFFKLRLKLISASTFTHLSRYRPFMMNCLSYIKKPSHNHIKKTTLVQMFHIRLIILGPLFTHILKSKISSLSTYLRSVSCLVRLTPHKPFS